MGSQSATVAKQSSSQLVGHSARNAQPSALAQIAEEQHSVPPGAGALPRSIAGIAAGGPSEPNPSRSLRLMPLSFPLQRKLAIGETHDPLESEAMADRVLRMTEPAAPVASSSAPPTLQRGGSPTRAGRGFSSPNFPDAAENRRVPTPKQGPR